MNVRAIPRLVKNAVRRAIPDPIRARLKPYQAYVHSAKHWNEEYAGGRWDYLEEVGELAHYSVVVGYCSFFAKRGVILDVGCGTGILMHRLRTVGYASYLGLDLSEAAIKQAKLNQDETTRFEVANAETYHPAESYDAIIFNETLYYLPDPRAILLRYTQYLRPGGIVIVSMHRIVNSLRMWRLLEGVVPIRDAVSLTNTTSGLVWDIKVYTAPASSQR